MKDIDIDLTEIMRQEHDKEPAGFNEAQEYIERCMKAAILADREKQDYKIKQLKKVFSLARNSAAGLTNYCEESPSTRRCERKLEEADKLYQEIQNPSPPKQEKP